MIKSVRLWRFKRWKDNTITLLPDGTTLLVGGNNSGKSSILQALALWSFCRTVLEFEKGLGVFYGEKHQGVGLSFEDFTAVPVPSFKHLWTNLKITKQSETDGYTLKVGVAWSPDGSESDVELEFGLALANDRLFVKITKTSVVPGCRIPSLAYLPPFGGLSDKETRLSMAERRRLIGLGQSGGTLRNVLLDYHARNAEERARLKGDKSKISNSDLMRLRSTDPWELVLGVIRQMFKIDLRVRDFNPAYHTVIRVESSKGRIEKGRWKKHNRYNYRDLMVEGSGFLQWLSVFTLAVAPDVDVLLLDEPDAHLHCSFQIDLLTRLIELGKQSGKQILLATHSTELIRSAPASRVANVERGGVKYLSGDLQKVDVLAGIGSEFSPQIHRLQKCKRLLLLESESDERLLEKWAKTLESVWPGTDDLVVWRWPSGHRERKQLFLQLAKEINDLKAISLRDRDDEAENTTDSSLSDKAHHSIDGFECLKWRRREIENYLIWPAAIASAAKVTEEEVRAFLEEKHSLSVSDTFKASDECPSALCTVDGKALMVDGPKSVKTRFGVTPEDVCAAMRVEDIPEDIATALKRIAELVA